jgi:hypothetical protein
MAAMVTSSGGNAATAGPAPASRTGDFRTGSGIFMAPRYLNHTGDMELSLDGGYLFSAGSSFANRTAVSFPYLGQLSLQGKLMDNLEGDIVISPITMVGLRGPLMQSDTMSVGWGAYYRSEEYVTRLSSSVLGLGRPFFGALDAIASNNGLSEARGAQLRLETLGNLNPMMGLPVTIYVDPMVVAMSNRTGAGAEFGADLDVGPLTLGWGGAWRYNFIANNPGGGLTVQPNEFTQTMGGRLRLNDSVYLQADYIRESWDTYGNFAHAVLGGVGFRWGGSSGSSAAPASSGGTQMRTSQ